jgi:hypothetical protein
VPVIVAAVVTLAAVGGGVAWMSRSKSADKPEAPVTTAAPAPKPEPVAAPVPPPAEAPKPVAKPAVKRVSLSIDSTPEGAEVRRVGEGKVLGETPFTDLVQSGGNVRYVLRKDGYADETVELDSGSDVSRSVSLRANKPVAPPPPPPAPKPVVVAPPPPAEPVAKPAKPSRPKAKKKSSDVLDPFE